MLNSYHILYCPDTYIIQAVLPVNIIHTIKNLKNERNPDWDNVPNKYLKDLTTNIIILLNSLFNCCLNRHYSPKIFKHAVIAAILNTNSDRNKPESYHHISLLPTAGKLLEHVIIERLSF